MESSPRKQIGIALLLAGIALAAGGAWCFLQRVAFEAGTSSPAAQLEMAFWPPQRRAEVAQNLAIFGFLSLGGPILGGILFVVGIWLLIKPPEASAASSTEKG